MRKTFILALAAAATTLGAVPMAQAQMAPNHGDHRGDHNDRRPNHLTPARGPQSIVSRDERLRMRASIRELDGQIMRARAAGKISSGASGGLRNTLRDIQQRYSSRLDGGLNRSEFASLNTSVNDVRNRFQAFLTPNRPHRR